MVCNWHTVELQLKKGGRTNFQMVQCSKNNKITNKIPFYTFSKFQGHEEVVWGNPLFTLKCTWWHHMVLTKNHGLDFNPLSEIILRVASPPKMILDFRSGELTIYYVSGPIHLETLLV
jgi:hypothetical protein